MKTFKLTWTSGGKGVMNCDVPGLHISKCIPSTKAMVLAIVTDYKGGAEC